MVVISEDVLARNRHLLGPGEDYWLAQRISRGINRLARIGTATALVVGSESKPP